MADDDTEEMRDDDTREAVIREGTSIPTWLAAALVVVLAIAIGGVGYAIGNSDSNNDFLEPIANIDGAGPGGITREGPGELGRGPGPGGPRGGFRGPGGEGPGEHRRGECRDKGEREGGDHEGEQDGDAEDGDSSDGLPFDAEPEGTAF